MGTLKRDPTRLFAARKQPQLYIAAIARRKADDTHTFKSVSRPMLLM